MTDEQTKAYIQALLAEREGYEKYGLTDRVAEVDAELDRVGRRSKAPAKRAAKMAPKGRTEV
jgi:hypothetical protein